MEAEAGIPMFKMLIMGVGGLVVVGGVFALIFWILGRGKDDDKTP